MGRRRLPRLLTEHSLKLGIKLRLIQYVIIFSFFEHDTNLVPIVVVSDCARKTV
jgi:hypothetical protein